jgi:hypothetical protein
MKANVFAVGPHLHAIGRITVMTAANAATDSPKPQVRFDAGAYLATKDPGLSGCTRTRPLSIDCGGALVLWPTAAAAAASARAIEAQVKQHCLAPESAIAHGRLVLLLSGGLGANETGIYTGLMSTASAGD